MNPEQEAHVPGCPRRQLNAEHAEIPESHLRSLHFTQKQKSASNFVHDGIQYITNSKTKTLRRGIYPAECFALSRTPCRLMHQVARFTSGKRYFA